MKKCGKRLCHVRVRKMIKKLWCFLVGHEYTYRNYNQPKNDGLIEPTWYKDEKADFCSKCGKDLK